MPWRFPAAAQLTLSGTNTYTGGTTVSGGTLDIAAPSALAGSGLVTIAAGGRLVLGSGAGIGALLAASSPASSDAVALSAAASVPATIGGYESASGNMATLGGAPPLSQGGGGSAVGGTAAAVPEPGTIALLARRRRADRLGAATAKGDVGLDISSGGLTRRPRAGLPEQGGLGGQAGKNVPKKVLLPSTAPQSPAGRPGGMAI